MKNIGGGGYRTRRYTSASMAANPPTRDVLRHWKPILRETWRVTWDDIGLYKGRVLIAWILATCIAALVLWRLWKPLMFDFLRGLLATALGTVCVFVGVFVWNFFVVAYKSYLRALSDSPSSSAPHAEPNLVFKTPVMGGGLICRDNVWTRGHSDTLRYIAWVVPIKNEAIPGKEVAKAERITAEIVLSSGGTPLLEVSPAPWVGEASRKIDVQSPDTKELIVAFKESVSGYGYWEMDFHGIPMGCSRGELKIRLPRERDSGTSYLATKFYKWRRAPELGDFWIEEVR